MPTKTHPRWRASFATGVLLLFATWQLIAAQTVVDSARGFTLTLPDGFVPNPRLASAAPDIVHAFVLGDPDDDQLDIVLFIEKIGGTIGRERFKPENAPPGFQGRLFTANWQGFEVNAFEVPERIGEISALTYNVQVPLKRGAIQVKLFGPAARERELKRLLAEVLNGLKGESNWIASAFPASSVTSSNHYGTVLLALGAVFVLGGLVALFLVSRRSPKGTVLAIAAGIYLASWAASGVRVREVLMLTGAMRMLGFAGVILGLFDLVRKRKPADPVGQGGTSQEGMN